MIKSITKTLLADSYTIVSKSSLNSNTVDKFYSTVRLTAAPFVANELMVNNNFSISGTIFFPQIFNFNFLQKQKD